MSRIDDLIHELCPNGVPFKSVAELGSVYGGLTGKSKQDFQAGNSRYVPYTQVFHYLQLETLPEPMVVTRPHERQTAVRRGDVLFTASSEKAEEVGMSCAVTSSFDEDVYLNSFCFGLRFHAPDQLRPEYAMYLFRSSSVRRQIVRTANGVTRFNISKKRFSRVVVPVPPLEVQDEIVRVLDTFSALEAELEAELEARRTQYEHYREALLKPGASGDHSWRWAELGDVITLNFGERITKKEHSGTQFPVYGGGGESFRTDSYNREDEYVVSRFAMSETCVRRVPGPFWLLDSGLTFDPSMDGLLKDYVGQWLFNIQSTIFATASQSAQKNLKVPQFKRLPIAFPSLKEQRRIVALLERFEALTTDLRSGLPAEIEARRKQYEYYRDRLLSFEEAPA